MPNIKQNIALKSIYATSNNIIELQKPSSTGILSERKPENSRIHG